MTSCSEFRTPTFYRHRSVIVVTGEGVDFAK